MKALNYEEPDRIPRHDSFWPEFIDNWRKEKGFGRDVDIRGYYGMDMEVVTADETPWPTRAGIISQNEESVTERTGWGTVRKTMKGSAFFEELESGVTVRVDPDKIVFDDASLDSRYRADYAKKRKEKGLAVFAKTGGPYLRSAFIRGEKNFLMDIAEDPVWTKAFVEKVNEHLTKVGCEQIKKYGLQSTGIGIYDDVASNQGTFMSPKCYEKIFYPTIEKMVKAYKSAGASKVFMHSDGNVTDLLDMWISAGIDAINPVEIRAGMDPVKLRNKYGDKLAYIGGLDNSGILVNGTKEEIEKHVLYLLSAGRGGGYVLCGHSIGPDISVENYELVCRIHKEYGNYPLVLLMREDNFHQEDEEYPKQEERH